MGLAVVAMARWLSGVWPDPALLPQLARLLAAIASGLAVLVLASRAMRIHEVAEVGRGLAARLTRRPVVR